MAWGRKEVSDTSKYYRRLPSDGDESIGAYIPKGFVPMLVGCEEGEEEKVMVNVRLLKDPCFAALLEMSALEFGYRQQGVVRIPCNVQQFHNMIAIISKNR